MAAEQSTDLTHTGQPLTGGAPARLADPESAATSVRELELGEATRRIGTALNYGVWTADADGRMTYVSPPFLTLTGKTLEQCLGSGWVDTLDPSRREQSLEDWRGCMAAGEPWSRTHRIIAADGSTRYVLTRGFPTCEPDGRVLGWMGMNVDVTEILEAETAAQVAERKAAEQERERATARVRQLQ
ncbi:MAG: PAS domain-containing protein, partial [Gemmatimonadaceae bacterium]